MTGHTEHTPLSNPPHGQRTVLGFDYGRRRIGVAVGQELTASARPLITLVNRDRPDWDGIDKLIGEWRPALLVVGLPHHADGSANAVTEAVRSFARQLERRFRLPVETIDERLSSLAAGERLAAGNAGCRRAGLDAAAAAVILESWLRENTLNC